METILHDDDVRAGLSPGDAVRWMGEAIDAHHRGDLLAPPRASCDLGVGRLVFTAGRLRGSWFGYRSYDTLATDPGAQLVVVHDEATGRVRAMALGNELGPRRVGGIGGAAADSLAPSDAPVMAVIGSGTQAFTQVWALATVRELREVRVYSRDSGRRAAFAERVAPLVGGACRAVPDARTACEGAQLVILATTSPAPVVQAEWMAPGAYVASLGPKQQGAAEFGPDLLEAASLLVTDSLDQIRGYDPPHALAGTPGEERLVGLGAVRAGELSPAPGGLSLFLSVGLAGTEAFLLDRLAAALGEPRG